MNFTDDDLALIHTALRNMAAEGGPRAAQAKALASEVWEQTMAGFR